MHLESGEFLLKYFAQIAVVEVFCSEDADKPILITDLLI